MMTSTLMLAGAGLAAAMGLNDAYSNKRSVPGWIVSVIASVVGGLPGGSMMVMGVMSVLQQGKDFSPTLGTAIGVGSVVVGVLLGSSIALWIVNRFG